jgi:hypothetical protein
MKGLLGARRPTQTQSTCLYYCHGNEASKYGRPPYSMQQFALLFTLLESSAVSLSWKPAVMRAQQLQADDDGAYFFIEQY